MVEQEDIRLFPVVGWQIATLPAGGVLVAIDYLPGEPSKPLTTTQMHALAEVHRFGMTAAQCDELAKALQRAARQSRKRESGEQ